MITKNVSFLISVILITFLGMAGPVTANEQMCDPKGELNFCIDGFETNKDTVTKGNVVEGEVRITNVGNESGSVVIIVGLENSEDEYSYYRVGVLHNLASGETQSYEFQLKAREDSTIGEHRINVRLMDMPENHLYDSTGYTSSIYLEKDPISLGWIVEQFNSFTVGLSALIGILAYLFGKRRIGLK